MSSEMLFGTHLFKHLWKALIEPTISQKGTVTKAIVEICGIENCFMQVLISWPNNSPYKGIIATFKNKWYFILGSMQNHHEIAQMVMLDPDSVGKPDLYLNGILLGCTEALPPVPTSVRVHMVKATGSNLKAVNLDRNKVDEKILAMISATVVGRENEHIFKALIPEYIIRGNS